MPFLTLLPWLHPFTSQHFWSNHGSFAWTAAWWHQSHQKQSSFSLAVQLVTKHYTHCPPLSPSWIYHQLEASTPSPHQHSWKSTADDCLAGMIGIPTNAQCASSSFFQSLPSHASPFYHSGWGHPLIVFLWHLICPQQILDHLPRRFNSAKLTRYVFCYHSHCIQISTNWHLLDQICYNLLFALLYVTEAYVQGNIEIQVLYPTDLYLPTTFLQCEQSLYKYLHQNFAILTKRIRAYFDIYSANSTYLRECFSWYTNASSHLQHAIPFFHNTWGMVTKYCQYELVNFVDKLHIQYNILSSFQIVFLFRHCKNTYKKIMNH